MEAQFKEIDDGTAAAVLAAAGVAVCAAEVRRKDSAVGLVMEGNFDVGTSPEGLNL